MFPFPSPPPTPEDGHAFAASQVSSTAFPPSHISMAAVFKCEN